LLGIVSLLDILFFLIFTPAVRTAWRIDETRPSALF